ncbi:MAG: site-specific DNA-methyltransferase [Propionibacteriaceae bacterium]|nr:site-specific DNA-methyltransferase [Propionibacteriaceae bacterium]
MTDHVILLAPSSNRVYSGSADVLAAAELTVLIGGHDQPTLEIAPVRIAGVDYLQLSVPELDDQLRSALSRLSALFAVFQRDGDRLLPFAVQPPDLFDDDLVTIPKYPGKTNEQFTRLLMNVTLAAVTRPASGSLSILDPMCGRGTTLSTGLIFGHDVAGVDADLKAVEAYAAYLRTYLRRKRIKHTAELSPVRRDGRSLGRRLDVEVAPAAGDHRLKLTVFSGDTRQSAALYGKRRFDAVVTDAPYGIVHGSQTDVAGVSGKRDRSPAGLIGEALSVWAGQLKSGGAFGLSWNTYGLSREALSDLAEAAGLSPLNEGAYLRFGHRVDSAIHRDIFVAVKD